MGTYYLSNLLQELKLAEESDSPVAGIDLLKIFENPVRRISRSIREIYWDALTRRIDREHLAKTLPDKKVPSGEMRYLYVPHSDATGYEYFSQVAQENPELRLQVLQLPQQITPQFVRNLNGKHGLLSLDLETASNGNQRGAPFIVPGGRFNEMHSWDSYFVALGLLADRRVALAKAMVDNFVYQINHYGKILNVNRTYYLTRSQPPFLTSMALAVYARLSNGAEDKVWLEGVLRAAIKEYFDVWLHPDRVTATGLSRYFGSGTGPPIEVEPGYFDPIFGPFAARHNMDLATFVPQYKSGEIQVSDLDRVFVHDRCVRESGHDTTYRWNQGTDRCADFVTVDLNSLLYKFELDIVRTIEREFGGEFTLSAGTKQKSKDWYKRAEKRKKRIRRYLWNEKRSLFFDYDLTRKKLHRYVSATTLYPLWAGYQDDSARFFVVQERSQKASGSDLAAIRDAQRAGRLLSGVARASF